mgnify:CR=1 FL=1
MTMPDKQSKKILLVDDEPDLLYFIGSLLRRRGYEIETAGDGIEALNKVKSGNYDMIITNINMPGIDGMQLLSEIAKLGKNLIKIVFSGQNDSLTIEKAEKLGCFAYIHKSSDFEELENAVKRGFNSLKNRNKGTI